MKKQTNDNRRFAEILRTIVRAFDWRILVGLMFAVGIILFFGWFASEVFEGETKVFDDSIRNFVHGFASPPLTSVMKFFSLIGSPLFLVILGAVVVSVFFYLKRKRAVALFLITVLGEVILSLTLKPFFGRARPAAYFDYPLPTSFSFPSGHAFASLCFFGVTAWLIATRITNQTIKIFVWLTAVLLIFCIGISRIYLGVHYPSDVLAGFAAGFIWLFTVIFADKWLRHADSSQN